MGFLLIPEVAVSQDLHPSRRLSPLGMARGFVGNVYVKVTFGQPYTRERDNIFGDGEDVMHPNGEVWRFGANEPTEITFSGPVSVGGKRLEQGTYSIFAVPGESMWSVHFNDLQGGGANEFDAANDVAVIEVTPSSLSEEEVADQFTISLEEQGDGLHMVASWTDWKLEVPIMPAR